MDFENPESIKSCRTISLSVKNKPKKAAYVYVMAPIRRGVPSAPVKIGMAFSPKERRRDRQTGCPFRLEIFHEWRFSTAAVAGAFEALLLAHAPLHSDIVGEWTSGTPTQILDIGNALLLKHSEEALLKLGKWVEGLAICEQDWL